MEGKHGGGGEYGHGNFIIGNNQQYSPIFINVFKILK